MKKKIKKVFFVLIILAFLDVLAVALTHKPYFDSYSSEKLPAESVGIIFFRGFDETYTFLSSDTLRRSNEAVRLYNAGEIREIACIGGARLNKNLYGSRIVKDYLISQGIPAEKIYVDMFSYDSGTNWQVVRDLVKQRQWTHISLIASPLHNKRLRRLVKDYPVNSIVNFSSYSYKFCNPKVPWEELWVDTHYEWLAYFAEFILPDQCYKTAIRQLRRWLP